MMPGGHTSVIRPVSAAGIVHDVALGILEDDPYPTYAWMRRHRPIAYVPETGRSGSPPGICVTRRGRTTRSSGRPVRSSTLSMAIRT